MNWMRAITELRSLGYEISSGGGKVTYVYRGHGRPAAEQVTALIEELKTHKEEIVSDPYFLICQTLQEINNGWTPGGLGWMKGTRPNDFRKMIALEEEIDLFALSRDINGLTEALRNYKDLMVGMARMFEAQRGDTGNLFKRGTGDR
jgi:hypothetical protein